MGTVTVKIKGGEALARKMKALRIDVEAALSEAVKAGALVIQDSAQAKAPGPHIEIDEKENKPESVTYEIGPDAEHWFYKFFETGASAHEIKAATAGAIAFEGAEGLIITQSVQHPGMVAKPFLRPAIDEDGDKAVEAVGKEFKAVIDRQCERR